MPPFSKIFFRKEVAVALSKIPFSLKAAKASGFEKSECIVIEDSTNGMKAANKAEIYCVAYKSEHSVNQDYSYADLIIDDFKEIAFSNTTSLLK